MTTEQRAIAALEEIVRAYGKVCENYDTCSHTACMSSYGAWATADKDLREIRAIKDMKEGVCPVCDVRFWLNPLKPQHRFCSERCSTTARMRRYRQRKTMEIPT